MRVYLCHEINETIGTLICKKLGLIEAFLFFLSNDVRGIVYNILSASMISSEFSWKLFLKLNGRLIYYNGQIAFDLPPVRVLLGYGVKFNVIWFPHLR